MNSQEEPTKKPQLYTVYLAEDCDEKGKWNKIHHFYRNIPPFTSDSWQIKEVPGKRKLAIALGQVTGPVFPIVYPLTLDDSTVLRDPAL